MDHQAFAQLLGNYGEFFGAVAVVATLLYLGRQISQTNQISIATGSREFQQQYTNFYTLIATNPEIRALVTKLRDPSYVVQSEQEEEQIESFSFLLLGIWLATAVAYEQGQINVNMYRTYCNDVEVKLSKWPGLRPHMVEIARKYPDTSKYEIFRHIYSG